MHWKEPSKQKISIFEDGFQYDNAYTAWGECKGFWMIRGQGYVELHIERQRGVRREFVIQTGSENPQKIRETLQQFLPEFTDRHESFIDMLSRILKI